MMSNFLDKWASESEKNKKICAREDLIIDVTEDILILMEDKGVSRSDLSRSLGKSRSFVSQTLSGARNMTLKTLSDICYVLEVKPEIRITDSLKHELAHSKKEYNRQAETVESGTYISNICYMSEYTNKGVYKKESSNRAACS